MGTVNVYDYIKNHEDVDVLLEENGVMHITVEDIGVCITDQAYTLFCVSSVQLRIETRILPEWNVFDWFGRTNRFEMIDEILPFDLHDYVLVEGKGETYVPVADKNGTIDFTQPKRAFYHVYLQIPMLVEIPDEEENDDVSG